jgi:hypothetical protein
VIDGGMDDVSSAGRDVLAAHLTARQGTAHGSPQPATVKAAAHDEHEPTRTMRIAHSKWRPPR